MLFARLRSYFLPSPASLTLMWAAGFQFGAAALLFAVYGVTMNRLLDAVMLLSFTSAPLAATLLTAAALREKRLAARALLWGAVTLVALGSLVGFMIPFGIGVAPEKRATLASFLLCCGLPILLPFLFMGISMLQAWAELRAILRAARYQRVLEMIEARGETTLSEIGRETSLAAPEAGKLVAELIASGELMAYVDQKQGQVYSVAALAEKQRRLLAMVEAHGQARLEELAAEVHASPELTRTWIYHLVQRGQFHGVVDWQQGIVYALDVQQVADRGRCPRCGGQLDVAGKGVIQCAHCQGEIFL